MGLLFLGTSLVFRRPNIFYGSLESNPMRIYGENFSQHKLVWIQIIDSSFVVLYSIFVIYYTFSIFVSSALKTSVEDWLQQKLDQLVNQVLYKSRMFLPQRNKTKCSIWWFNVDMFRVYAHEPSPGRSFIEKEKLSKAQPTSKHCSTPRPHDVTFTRYTCP